MHCVNIRFNGLRNKKMVKGKSRRSMIFFLRYFEHEIEPKRAGLRYL